MKKYTIFYFDANKDNRLSSYTIQTEMGFNNVMAYFNSGVSHVDTISSIHTEIVEKDTLIDFLDNNPNTAPEPTTKVLTYEQQMDLYNEGYEACERVNHIND